MRKKGFWKVVMAIFTALSLLALLSPQSRIVVWETNQRHLLYFWGGHSALGADVSGLAYFLGFIMGTVAASLMLWGFRELSRERPRAIALFNWAALFVALELVFLLGIAEEVLTDLRAKNLHADSYASWGGAMSEFLLIALLFVPGWVKKAYFPRIRPNT